MAGAHQLCEKYALVGGESAIGMMTHRKSTVRDYEIQCLYVESGEPLVLIDYTRYKSNK